MTLQQLSDRREIEDQIVAYSYAVDFHRWDDLDAVFTEDAVLDFTASGGEKGDLTAIKDFFDRALNLFTGHQHLMGNVRVVLDGDVVTSTTMCHNPMYVDTDGGQRLIFVGIWYHDSWRRTPDGWRIAERVQEKGYLHGL